MIFKDLYVRVLWTKVTSALEGLSRVVTQLHLGGYSEHTLHKQQLAPNDLTLFTHINLKQNIRLYSILVYIEMTDLHLKSMWRSS